MKKTFLFLTTVCLYFGCKSTYPEDPLLYFDVAEKITAVSIELDNELHGSPAWSIEYDHPFIVVVETRYLFGKMFFLIDLENKTVRKIIDHGRGDCEFNHVFLSSLNAKEKYFTFLDNDRNAYYKFLIDSIDIRHSSYKYCPEKLNILGANQSRFNDLKPIDNRYYIGYKDDASDLMYTIFDTKKDTVYHQLAYPELKGLSQKEMKIGKRIFWGYTHVAPDRKKIALIAQPTLIEIMDWDNGNLTRKKRLKFYDYRFRVDYKNNSISRRGFGNKEGFLLGAVTNNYIYVGYCGHTVEEMAKMGKFPSVFSILVFDWDGNPIKRYELNRTVVGFVVKDDDSGMYGTSIGAESIDLVEYNFNHHKI